MRDIEHILLPFNMHAKFQYQDVPEKAQDNPYSQSQLHHCQWQYHSNTKLLCYVVHTNYTAHETNSATYR